MSLDANSNPAEISNPTSEAPEVSEPASSGKVENSRPRAIFLDVDGTYADFGVVPAAHVEAVRKARAAGNKVFISTGRPMSMLSDAILGAGFDGVVASAGAYLTIDGQVLMDRRIPDDLAARALEVLSSHEVAFVLESPDWSFVLPHIEEKLRAHVNRHFVGKEQHPEDTPAILTQLKVQSDLSQVRFAKITVFESQVPLEDVIKQIGPPEAPELALVANSIDPSGLHSGEIFYRGVSKADGVAAALDHLRIPREDSVAFGDGENDLEMLDYVGLGVAIEGASPKLLALADATALPPSRNGLAKAFVELGLV